MQRYRISTKVALQSFDLARKTHNYLEDQIAINWCMRRSGHYLCGTVRCTEYAAFGSFFLWDFCKVPNFNQAIDLKHLAILFYKLMFNKAFGGLSEC